VTRDATSGVSALHGPSDGGSELPDWMRRIHEVMPAISADQLTRLRPPAGTQTRAAAVLMVFSGRSRDDAHVLLLERSSTLAWFFAAARTIDGPPMSICSTQSCGAAPDITVSVNG